jgi:radical SAM superfamily enzyme YgiQ (UPF0313 family)
MSYDELNEDVLDMLFATGFRYTYIGLESYNNTNLSILSKKQSIEHCIRMVNACLEKHIHCDVSYQIGLPGESLIDIEKSLDWLKTNGLEKRVFFNITAIWPETALAKKHGVLPEDYEPTSNKKILEQRGLYYFDVHNELDEYFSNCSGTFHFISYATAIKVKEMLFEMGFFNRFELTDQEFERIEIL